MSAIAFARATSQRPVGSSGGAPLSLTCFAALSARSTASRDCRKDLARMLTSSRASTRSQRRSAAAMRARRHTSHVLTMRWQRRTRSR